MTISDRARDLIHGRRGGRWLPQNHNEPPFGVVDGVKSYCPAPVFVRCTFCSLACWASPVVVENGCHMCGAPLAAEDVPA